MALTERQRKIINPYAENTNSDMRRGVGYDYEDESNKFVIDAIQEKYLYFFDFPKIGESLKGRDRTITQQDMLAYFALYPQNGKVLGEEVNKISDTEALQALEGIAGILQQQNVLEKYSSRTSELTYQEDYQARQGLANLIAIPPAHSKQYKNQLREALGLPEVQYSDDVGLDLLNLRPDITTYISSDSNVDLYDWRKNGLPGEDNNRVYFNPVDSNYYYVKRTEEVQRSSYAFNELRTYARSGIERARSRWSEYTEEQRNRYSSAVENSIREILKLTGRHSEENVAQLLEKYGAPNTFSLLSYRDLRPGSRWIYALQINTIDINNLPEANEQTFRPSYQEYELSGLQKAKRIIGSENQSQITVNFRVEDMLRYMFSVRSLLQEYNAKLLDDGLTPAVLNGIDLAREADRLETFFDLLSIFYGYNKISLEDDDRVQMYFTGDYLLDHICINGSFYYQGCGNKTYLNLMQEQARIANAFSLYTPTTFSLIKNSYEIYVYSKNTATSALEGPLDFLSKYVYPSAQVDAVRAKRANARSKDDQRRKKKRKDLFAKLSELSKTSPGEYERLFSNRPLTYRMSSTLSSIDCNTGQAKAAKYALKFWQAATGKTKIRSLIRETIILLRQEIIEDEITKRRISQGANYAQNPALAISQIEKAVNQQIFCSLDVLGDFIEDSFLDPIGAPPVANTLVRKTLDEPIKIEFTKRKMISLKTKQSKIYRKAIETILLNFLKSVVAGVAKDIVNALLGCGPKGNKRPNSGLKNSFKSQDYGFTDLNDYLDEVDLVSIARAVNLVSTDSDGNQSEPTLEQLTALIGDVSLMSTPVELQQLLDGDASNELEEHLLETVSSNRPIRFIYPFSEPSEEPVYIAINPRVYNTINFSDNKLIDFFMFLGNAIENAGDFGDLPFRSPLEAYCDQKDSFTNPLELNFDIPEIEAQYDDIVSDKINKINNLCNWLRDLTNIKFELERLIDSLPMMTWYDDFLQFIALLSNSFTEWLAGLFSDLFGKEQTTRQQPTYNLYNSKMGTELFYQLGSTLRQCSINQLYRTNSGDVIFQTPASYGSADRDRFELLMNNQGEVEGIEGRFGSRRNGWTTDNVYNYLWAYRGSGILRNVPILPMPQYRSPQLNAYDNYDIAYYSIRNSPRGLIKRLKGQGSNLADLLRPESLNRISYGSTGRSSGETTQISKIAIRVDGYLKDVENNTPYIGYSGVSTLQCANPQNGDVRIVYWDPASQYPTLAYYNPAGTIHNETSISSSMQVIGQNGDYSSVDYRIFNNLDTGQNTFSLNNQYQMFVDGVLLPPVFDTREIYSNFSIGLPFATPSPQQLRTSPSSRDLDLVSVQNYRERIDTQIDFAAINETGRRRMPRYVAAVGKLPLEKTDDVCVTQEDVFRAESAVQLIQTRMISFFMNIMPLARVYPCWGSMGTIQLIVGYLHGEISKELESREMLGSFYQSMQYIKLVFPQDSEDDDFKRNPIIEDSLTPEANMRNIIESIYLGMLDNISTTSEYSGINRSVFDPEAPSNTKQRYENTLVKFYKILEDADLSLYGIPDLQSAIAVKEKIRQFYNGDDITELGMLVGAYYFPVAFQIASYMVYYDRGIKYANRYSDTQYRILVEQAASDDNLLTAIKGQVVQKFSQRYQGFPVTVDTWNADEVLYYSADQVEIRVQFLDDLPRSTWNGSLTSGYRTYLSSLGFTYVEVALDENQQEVDRRVVDITNNIFGIPQKQGDIISTIIKNQIRGAYNVLELDINNIPNTLESSNAALRILIERGRSFEGEEAIAANVLLERILAGQETSIVSSFGSYASFWNPENFNTTDSSYDGFSNMDQVNYYEERPYAEILEEKSILEKLIITNE